MALLKFLLLEMFASSFSFPLTDLTLIYLLGRIRLINCPQSFLIYHVSKYVINKSEQIFPSPGKIYWNMTLPFALDLAPFSSTAMCLYVTLTYISNYNIN